jgi:hypothetical protein
VDGRGQFGNAGITQDAPNSIVEPASSGSNVAVAKAMLDILKSEKKSMQKMDKTPEAGAPVVIPKMGKSTQTAPDDLGKCQAGKFKYESMTSAGLHFTCQACDSGQFSATGGFLTSCTPCPAGKHQSYPEQPKCLSCEAGAYQPHIGQLFCHTCPAGKWNTAVGQTDCSAEGAKEHGQERLRMDAKRKARAATFNSLFSQQGKRETALSKPETADAASPATGALLPLPFAIQAKTAVGTGPSKICGAHSETRETRWFR